MATQKPDEIQDPITILYNGTIKYYVPKARLIAKSPVFACMFAYTETLEAQHKQIEFTDIDIPVQRALIQFLNYDIVESTIIRKHAVDLLIVADKYQIKSLTDYVEYFLITSNRYKKSLLEHLNMSIQLNCPNLLSHCIDQLHNPMHHNLLQTKDYSQLLLDNAQNCSLLSSLFLDLLLKYKQKCLDLSEWCRILDNHKYHYKVLLENQVKINRRFSKTKRGCYKLLVLVMIYFVMFSKQICTMLNPQMPSPTFNVLCTIFGALWAGTCLGSFIRSKNVIMKQYYEKLPNREYYLGVERQNEDLYEIKTSNRVNLAEEDEVSDDDDDDSDDGPLSAENRSNSQISTLSQLCEQYICLNLETRINCLPRNCKSFLQLYHRLCSSYVTKSNFNLDQSLNLKDKIRSLKCANFHTLECIFLARLFSSYLWMLMGWILVVAFLVYPAIGIFSEVGSTISVIGFFAYFFSIYPFNARESDHKFVKKYTLKPTISARQYARSSINYQFDSTNEDILDSGNSGTEPKTRFGLVKNFVRSCTDWLFKPPGGYVLPENYTHSWRYGHRIEY